MEPTEQQPTEEEEQQPDEQRPLEEEQLIKVQPTGKEQQPTGEEQQPAGEEQQPVEEEQQQLAQQLQASHLEDDLQDQQQDQQQQMEDKLQEQQHPQQQRQRQYRRCLSTFDVGPSVSKGGTYEAQPAADGAPPLFGFDVLVTIVGATNLPGHDWWNGLSDPYVVVKVPQPAYDGAAADGASSTAPNGGKAANGGTGSDGGAPPPIRYRTATVWRDLNPTYDEFFELGNFQEGAWLEAEVWDRDLVTPDDLIGTASWQFAPQQKQQQGQEGQQACASGRLPLRLQLRDPRKASKVAGQLELEVQYQPSQAAGPTCMLGPVRFRQHLSRMTGLLMFNWNDDSSMAYSTYKIYLCHIPTTFRAASPCPWNRAHPPAAAIFRNPVLHAGVRQTHAALYATHHLAAARAGVLREAPDFFQLFNGGVRGGQRRYFTYTLLADSLRCSETGAAFFLDMMSKHAMHAGGAEEVMYAGEFCIVPDAAAPGGHRLVVDNNSGTYAPPGDQLPLMHQLFTANFPGMAVETLAVDDPRLDAYHRQCPSRTGSAAAGRAPQQPA